MRAGGGRKERGGYDGQTLSLTGTKGLEPGS